MPLKRRRRKQILYIEITFHSFYCNLIKQSGYMCIKRNGTSSEPCLSVCSEERQQTSLTEWCDARLDVSQPDAPREKTHTCVLQENDLLDDGGDSVFSQMVLSLHVNTFSLCCSEISGVFAGIWSGFKAFLLSVCRARRTWPR